MGVALAFDSQQSNVLADSANYATDQTGSFPKQLAALISPGRQVGLELLLIFESERHFANNDWGFQPLARLRGNVLHCRQ